MKPDSVFKMFYGHLWQGVKSFKQALIGVIHKLVRVGLSLLGLGNEFESLVNRPATENVASAL